MLERKYAQNSSQVRPKVTWRKPQGKKSGRWLVRCMCGCGATFEIYPDTGDGSVEIAGVLLPTRQLTKELLRPKK